MSLLCKPWSNQHNGDRGVSFWCSGCQERHSVRVGPGGWEWNGSLDAPTISPSVLVRSGHFMPGHTGDCWCTYNAARPEDPAKFRCTCCHSFVRDGRIEYLSDCAHALAGQTVDLVPIVEESSDDTEA
ncbi:MAG: DUF6527 family protein [Acidobacteriota bacterium]